MPFGLDKKLLYALIPIGILILAVAAGIILVSRNQEIRSEAAVVQQIPLGSPDEIRRTAGALATLDLSELDEQTRTQPSFAFVNSVELGVGEAIGVFVNKVDSGESVVEDRGIGGRQIIEYLIDPGDYSVTITDLGSGDALHRFLLVAEPNSVNVLMRVGTPLGAEFILDRFTFSDLPDLRFYNLTNDSDFAITGGSLEFYDRVLDIGVNSFRDLLYLLCSKLHAAQCCH